MLVQTVCSTLLQGCHVVKTGTDSMDVNQLTRCISKCAKSYQLKNRVQPAGILLLIPTTHFPSQVTVYLYCITQNITLKQHMT
jgi:hypothetical protein